MTIKEAKKLGWKIKKDGDVYDAEKGRVILMDVPEALLLKMIEKSEGATK